MKIGFGSDHAGVVYRRALVEHAKKLGYEIFEVGATSPDNRVDYPDVAAELANEFAKGSLDRVIAVCGSGEGICISLNKYGGIRCGIGYNDSATELMRKHNDCNSIAFGEREMTLEECLKRFDIFMNTGFEGGRHEERVNKIEGNL